MHDDLAAPSPTGAPPPAMPASEGAAPGALRMRELALPILVVVAVLALVGAVLPLAVVVSVPHLGVVLYWAFIAYLLAVCLAMGGLLAGRATRPLPFSSSRREAILIAASILAAGGYLVGFLVFQVQALLQPAGGPAQPTSTLSQGLALLGLLGLYLLLGGISFGIGLYLWLARRQLPLGVTRFAGRGVAVAAVLAGIALARQNLLGTAAGPLVLFLLGLLVTLPLGVMLAARLLPANNR